MNLSTSARVARLKKRAMDNMSSFGRETRMVLSPSEFENVENLRITAWERCRSDRAIAKRAAAFEYITAEMDIFVLDDELIVGSQRGCNRPAGGLLENSVMEEIAARQKELGMVFSDGHIVANYGKVLRRGWGGIREELEAARRRPDLSDEQKRNIEAFQICAEAASAFVFRFSRLAAKEAATEKDENRKGELLKIARTCEKISEQPADHFDEALQSLWFTHLLLHIENPGPAYSLGRLDRMLDPYLRKDLNDGYITERKAAELLDCLWIKFFEGGESQNITLGGCDENGADVTSPMTFMAIDSAERLHAWQPSLSVRIHDKTPEPLFKSICRLIQTGTGQPSLFNDNVIISSLVMKGLSEKDAKNYSIVGCYEPTGTGNEYGLTTAPALNLAESINAFVRMEGGEKRPAFKDFDHFLRDYKRYLYQRLDESTRKFDETVDKVRAELAPTPFKSILLEGCVEGGTPVEQGGSKYNVFARTFLGLGTLTDSLSLIKKMVYDENRISLWDMARALEMNFSGYEELRKRINSCGLKYGNDIDDVDSLGVELAEYLCSTAFEQNLSRGAKGYAALFCFLGNVNRRDTEATPDGRRKGDYISYGIAPAIGSAHNGVTAVLNSASKLKQSLAPGGCPLTVSLMQRNVRGEQGRELLTSLIKTYFGRGGFHLHFNLTDVGKLEEARIKPEKHPDLMIRISGYSARFVALSPELQDELIQRVKDGI